MEPANNNISSATASQSATSVAPGISVTLFPAVEALLADANTDLQQIELIAVAVGPGSFTGLRVGVVMAKTLAYLTKIPLVGVNTLEVISAQTALACPQIAKSAIKPVLNAQRQQLFGGSFTHRSGWAVQRTETDQIFDRLTWIESLQPHDLITGSGISLLNNSWPEPDFLADQQIQLAPQSVWECTAESVGLYGQQQWQTGGADDVWTLEPIYFRPSTAEEVKKAGIPHQNRIT